MSANTGGPAFPIHGNGMFGEPVTLKQGMTLLDWMAGQALAGYRSQATGNDFNLASECYDDAEAMLAEKARREATGKESSTTDHSPDATEMIPGGFAEDTIRRLAADVLHADINDASNYQPLTWCAEQVRARVNTLEALNRELVEALSGMRHADNCFCSAAFEMPGGSNTRHAPECEKARAVLAKAKEVA